MNLLNHEDCPVGTEGPRAVESLDVTVHRMEEYAAHQGSAG
jgi:hypothetical protein